MGGMSEGSRGRRFGGQFERGFCDNFGVQRGTSCSEYLRICMGNSKGWTTLGLVDCSDRMRPQRLRKGPERFPFRL